jgi:hypothetical protein
VTFYPESVDGFLQAVREAKSAKRQAVDDSLKDQLEDPDCIGIPADLSRAVDGLIERYGDEALRSISLWAIGKWILIHQRVLDQRLMTEDSQSIVLTAGDLTALSHGLRMVSEVGSFGGDDHWRAMLKDNLGQAILEGMEEIGYDPLHGTGS